MSAYRNFPRLICIGLSATLVFILMASCSKPEKPAAVDKELKRLAKQQAEKACDRPPLEVFLQAGSDINANASGQPMPVEVRIFLLRKRELFDELDFEGVWKNAKAGLKDTLVKVETVMVFPNKVKIYPLKSDPGINFVAVVGIYREPPADGWRYVADVRKMNSRCAKKDSLHTVVAAELHGRKIYKPGAKPETPKGK